MAGTAIINPAKYRISRLKFNFKNSPIRLNDLSEINVELLEQNKIQFLILGVRGCLTPNLLHLVKQCKLCFPYLVMILIIDEVQLSDTLSYFKSGIDHIVPFHGDYEKLQKEINAIFTIYDKHSHAKLPTMQYRDLVIDPNSRKVSRNGIEIHLSRKEFDLLEFLAMHIGVPFSRSIILEAVWGYQNDIFSNTVDVHFSGLRRKIDKPFHLKLLHTIHGMGYKLEAI